ncbi:MAG: hypothetical protein ACOYI5_04855 [Christensenellales bacterium]|jgi:uncharacterized membrane protein
MTNEKIAFDEADVRTNKDMASLGYVLFFIPLLTCKDSKLGRFCANQGLLLMITYFVARFVLGFFRWLFLYEFLSSVVSIGLLALGIYLAYQLRKHDKVTRLPYIGHYTLIK